MESGGFIRPEDVKVPQPKLVVLVQVLADRAAECDTDIRWGHVLTGFDQNADGVTVQVSGPDGRYELTSRYLVGADSGTSDTRKLAPGLEAGGRGAGPGRSGAAGHGRSRRTAKRSTG